ncbi:hypothetical protein Ami103574_10945 [Aminipila butyrica]|uniref:Uncharacterized protein n=1 Tax=Aminipila butyrica TaxID=433296 RepID=A0A858C0A6_9FIRM|nr:hypothetical protein [Aminipila butyrica]QIB69806.1 hypothetical protein Ami103574_10945 [Aminipila butyrica]
MKDISARPLVEGRPLDELEIPDSRFKPNSVHLAIMKEAKANNGCYDRRIEIEKIKGSSDPEKLKKQRLLWNQINLNNLVNAGYMRKKDENIYIANPLAYNIQRAEFQPGKNHAQLLLKNKEGIIKTLELKKELSGKKSDEQRRQKKILDGMVKRLYENGYLEKIDKGKYKVTDAGFQFLNEWQSKKPTHRDQKVTENRKTFAATKFDRHIQEIVRDGKIDEQLLQEHDKCESLKKRITTYKKQGLITNDGELTEDCINLLENTLKRGKEKHLSLEMLSDRQIQLIKDIRIFLNLSKDQIVHYIYGDQAPPADTDLQFLIRKKIIKRDEDTGIYVMDKAGIELSNELLSPNAVRYYTKLYSRKEEVEHDMLVYTAYKEWEKGILEKGYKIIEIKNDRQLRREDAQKHGHMIGAYPDLRVLFQKPNSNKILTYDIEVDCGYDSKTIKSKLSGLGGNLGWYCKTLYQAAKVANMLTKDTTKVSRMNVARKMEVYYMDKDGKLQVVRQRHWNK